jgi:hypothetical protein
MVVCPGCRGRGAAGFIAVGIDHFPHFGLDAAIRCTKLDHEGGVCASAVRNLGDPKTLADDNLGGLTGVFSLRSDKRDAISWTVGAEYKIDPRVQLFARDTDSERLSRLQTYIRPRTSRLPVSSRPKADCRRLCPACPSRRSSPTADSTTSRPAPSS